jgi:hypothetical protein
MTIYAIYTRTAKGTIQRDQSMFEWNGSLGPYVHKAPLKGWCESTVFWVYEKGHSTGLAPICASPSEVVAIQPSFDNRSQKNHRVIGG